MTNSVYLIDDKFRVLIDSNEIIMNYNLENDSRFKIEHQTMEVLKILIESKGNIVLRKRMLKTIWEDYEGGEEGINQAISKLRKIFLDDAKNSKIIETISKKGYRIIAKIEQEFSKDETSNSHNQKILIASNKQNRIVSFLEYLKEPKHLILFITVVVFAIVILYIVYKIIYALVWS